jgi:hypothetical protein
MRMSSIWGETTSLHLYLLLQYIQEIYLRLHLQHLQHSMTTLGLLPDLHSVAPPANALSLGPSGSAMRH